MQYYKLEETKVTPCSLPEWTEYFKKLDRILWYSSEKGIQVSTVFLGIDHNFDSNGPPLLFESMVFGVNPEVCNRYSTYDLALTGHKALCQTYKIRFETPVIKIDEVIVKTKRPLKLVIRR